MHSHARFESCLLFILGGTKTFEVTRLIDKFLLSLLVGAYHNAFG